MVKLTIIGDPHAKLNNLDKINELFNKIEDLGHTTVILGDLLDTKAIVRSQCLNAYINYFKNSKLNFIILVGNHDLHEVTSTEHSLEPLKLLPNVTIVDEPMGLHHGFFMPYMHDEVRVKAAIKQMPKGSVLFGHLELKGFDFGNGFICPKGMTGKSFTKFKRVISGHFHCFSEDTEVLTDNGWKNFNKVDQDNDKVVTMDMDTGKFIYNKIEGYVEREVSEKLIRIKSSKYDSLVTNEHRIIAKNKREIKYSEFLAKSPRKDNLHYPISGQLSRSGLPLDDNFLRLIIWSVTDGCIEDNAVRFHLSKDYKIKALVNLLNNIGIKYTLNTQKTGNTKIRSSAKDEITKAVLDVIGRTTQEKRLPEILRQCNRGQVEIIFETYRLTDGSISSYTENSLQISTSKVSERDLLQEIFVTNNFSCTSSTRKFENPQHEDNYILYVYKDKTTVEMHYKTVYGEEFYEGKVFCFSVPNGTLLVRRNGKPYISGNCFQQKGNLTYLGTPFSHSYGETNQDKFIGVYDTESDNLEVIPTKGLFPAHMTINVNCDDPNPSIEGYTDIDHIRVIYTGTQENIDKAKLKYTFPEGTKFIEKSTDEFQEGLQIEETLDNQVKFNTWAKDIKGLDEETVQLGMDILETVK